MKIKKLIKNNDGVVGIIVAILLIGLLISVISIVQTVFIPNWMKEIEAEHMDTISEQFAQLKFAVDLQIALDNPDLPISTPITLGNKGFPLLQSSKSYGSIDIIENKLEINIVHENGTSTIPLGEIKYSSDNFYYLDQDFIYETGALIVNQDEGNIITIKPEFNLERDGNDVFLNLTLTNISSVANKKSASGYGVYPIRLEYNGFQDLSSEINLSSVSEITINTLYPEAWILFFNNLLKNMLILDSDIDDILIPSPNPGLDITDLISVFPPADDFFLNISIKNIDAQVAPGWIDE